MHQDRIKIAGIEYRDQLLKSKRGYTSPNYYPENIPDFQVNKSKVELLAYYLPQFHPFAENDEWWGKGFTEWTNVTRARPQFLGHYQPHLPSDLGFYDLRNPDTMKMQIELARAYGIRGFVFYYYWFNGRRVLERPLDLFMSNKDMDIDFSLCWANENWTRRWDGAEQEVLLGQVHTAESDERFIVDVLKYMDDPRYIHIDGKPLLTVYRIGLLPDLKDTVERWRSVARKTLGRDLYLVYAMTFGEKRVPQTIGFDAAIQFPPHATSSKNISSTVEPFGDDFAGSVFDYESVASSARNSLRELDFPVIPGVFPSWDNTARRGENAHLFLGSSPDTYGSWLAEACHHAYRKPVSGRSLVVINAWNEWAEGAHLEPDQENGHAYLRTTADILRPYIPAENINTSYSFDPSASIPTPTAPYFEKTAIIIHAYYADALDKILTEIPEELHSNIFITTSDQPSQAILAVIASRANKATLLFFPNKGRDIRPFLGAIKVIKQLGLPYFVKLHTKKSVHRADGESWCEELYIPLCQSLRNRSIEAYFDEQSDVGIIAPKGHVLNGLEYMGSAQNFEWIKRLYDHFGFAVELETFQFVAGSMFAGRTGDFSHFADDDWLAGMFEDEMGRRDGTLAHALERYFGAACSLKGKLIADVEPGGSHFTKNRHTKEVYRFAEEQRWGASIDTADGTSRR